MIPLALVIPIIAYISISSILLQENFPHAKKISASVFACLSVCLVLLATFRPETLPDYGAYSHFYYSPDKDRFEFTANIIKSLSPSLFCFMFLYAIISVSIKLKAIQCTSSLHILSLLCYFVLSYPLHELVQIRAGTAIAMYLYAIHYLRENKFKYVVCILLAACFHYSALVALPFVILNAKTFKKGRWYLLILISCFCYFVGIDIAKIMLSFVSEGSYLYLQLLTNTEKTNVFNSMLLAYIFIFFVLSECYKKQVRNPYTCILLKILACTICILPLTASASIITFRLFEFLGTSLIFLLPNFLYICKRRITGYLMFFLFFLFFFWQKIIRVGYLG